jgi:hypothetical protein
MLRSSTAITGELRNFSPVLMTSHLQANRHDFVVLISYIQGASTTPCKAPWDQDHECNFML